MSDGRRWQRAMFVALKLKIQVKSRDGGGNRTWNRLPRQLLPGVECVCLPMTKHLHSLGDVAVTTVSRGEGTPAGALESWLLVMSLGSRHRFQERTC